MATSMDHDLTRRDPYQGADMQTDVANIVSIALKEQADNLVRFDNDVRVESDGESFFVDVPYATSRVAIGPRDKYPDMIAKLAMEEAGLRLLAASRATEVVWRAMQRVAAS